jgi:putative transposase
MGRKRHLLVDTLGLVLQAVVHTADLHDRQGGRLLIQAVKGRFPRLSKIWADQGYLGAFARWAAEILGVDFEVVYPWWRQIKRYFPELYEQLKKGFQVIPKRWIVERTFAWLTFQRRLVKDYEYLVQTSENLIYLAMIRLMLKRLAS